MRHFSFSGQRVYRGLSHQLAQLRCCLICSLIYDRPLHNGCSTTLNQRRWAGGWRVRLRVAGGGAFLIAGLGFQGLVKPVLRHEFRKETRLGMILPHQSPMHQPGQGANRHLSLTALLPLHLVHPVVTQIIPLMTHDGNDFVAIWIPIGLLHDRRA